MEKVLISAQQDYWFFQEEWGNLKFNLLLRSRFLNEVSYFDCVIDQVGNPHIIAEKGGVPKYYNWNGISWKGGPHPTKNFVVPYYLAVPDNNQVMLLAYQKTAEGRKVYQLFLDHGHWWHEKTEALPDGAVIIALKSLGEKGLLVLYRYWEGIKEWLGIAFYGQGKWQRLNSIPVEGNLLNWFYEPGKLDLLLGEVHSGKKFLSLLRVSLADAKEDISKVTIPVSGWDAPPGIFRGQREQLKICWTYLGKILLVDLEREKLLLINQRESEVFYPAEFLSGLSVTGRVPFSYVVLKKVNGIKLEPPWVLKIDVLDEICGKEMKNSLCPQSVSQGLNYKLKVVRSPDLD